MNTSADNNPYVGPRPFETKDRLYGREREISELDHLLSAERIVLLYSPSGAGKSSLINAGIIPRLDWYYALKGDQPTAGRFDCWPPTRVNSPRPTDFEVKNRFAWSAAMGWEQEVPDAFRRAPAALANLSLKDVVAGRRRRRGAPTAVLLIFDQFEEVLRVDPLGVAEKEAFFDQLGELLSDPQIWALFVLREDYLAALDPYRRRLPTHLSHRYRIDRLSREAAAQAVAGPTRDTPRKFAPGVVEQFVEDLAQVKVQQPDGTFVAQTGNVEPMHLQVVCVRLWDRMAPDDLLIDRDDVTTFGDVDQALANYYESSVVGVAAGDPGKEREIRDWFEGRLITAGGVRRQVLLGVDKSEGLANTQIYALVDTYLVRVEPRAGATWFELAHDRLVSPIQRSNAQWRSRTLAPFQRQAKLWDENARSDDMLFTGSELTEALRFAQGNPQENLTPYDRAFLDQSRAARGRIEAEQQRIREIEEQSREIADKNSQIRSTNTRLRAWRRWLLVTSVAALGFLAFSLFTLMQLQSKEIFGELKRSVAVARGGASAEAMSELSTIAEKHRLRPDGGLQRALDQGLMEVLANHPRIERRLSGDNHIVRALRFSADDRRLYSGGWDDQPKVWLVDGTPGAAATGKDHTTDIRSLAYHRGRQILVSADDDGLVKLWDVGGETPLLFAPLEADQSAPPDAVRAAALSPDGQRLATAGKDRGIVLWDIVDPRRPKQLGELSNSVHHDGIYRLAYIEEGPYAGALVSADRSGKVGIWRVPEDRLKGPGRPPDLELTAHGTGGGPVAILSLAVSPSGRWVAVGDDQGGVRGWALDSDKTVSEPRRPCYQLHRGRVRDMAFSADSTTLVTVGADGVLRWDLPDAAQTSDDFCNRSSVKRFAGWGEGLYSVAFYPQSNRQVAVGGTKTLWLADLSRPNALAQPIESSNPSSRKWVAMTATADLSLIAAIEEHDGIHLWEWEKDHYHQPRPRLAVASDLDRIALSPDGRTLVGLACTGKLVIYTLSQDGGPATDPQELTAPPPPGSKGCAITFAPRGQSFATGIGTSLQLWSRSDSGSWQLSDPKDLGGSVRALAFSPNGDRLASAGRLDHILLWGVADKQLQGPLAKSAGVLGEPVRALAFAPDRQVLVSGGDDASVNAWRLPNLDKKSQSNLHGRRLTALAYGRRDGANFLVSADVEGQLVLCADGVDDQKCARLGRLGGSEIRGMAVSQDFSRLIVMDDALWVWDLGRQSMRDTVRDLSQ